MKRNNKSITEFIASGEPQLKTKDWTMSKLEDGSFWLVNDEGEGMQASEKQIEKMLSQFFNNCF